MVKTMGGKCTLICHNAVTSPYVIEKPHSTVIVILQQQGEENFSHGICLGAKVLHGAPDEKFESLAGSPDPSLHLSPCCIHLKAEFIDSVVISC